MDNEEFGDIAQYFNNLIEIDKYRLGETSPETNNIDIQQSIPKHFPTLDEQGRTALEHINKYIAKPRQDLDPSE